MCFGITVFQTGHASNASLNLNQEMFDLILSDSRPHTETNAGTPSKLYLVSKGVFIVHKDTVKSFEK